MLYSEDINQSVVGSQVTSCFTITLAAQKLNWVGMKKGWWASWMVGFHLIGQIYWHREQECIEHENKSFIIVQFLWYVCVKHVDIGMTINLQYIVPFPVSEILALVYHLWEATQHLRIKANKGIFFPVCSITCLALERHGRVWEKRTVIFPDFCPKQPFQFVLFVLARCVCRSTKWLGICKTVPVLTWYLIDTISCK